MISQAVPLDVPFTLLDYGLAVLVLIVLGFTIYLFVKFLTRREQVTIDLLTELVKGARTLQENHFELREAVLLVVDELRQTQGKVSTNYQELQRLRREALEEQRRITYPKHDPKEGTGL